MDVWFNTGFFGELEVIVESEEARWPESCGVVNFLMRNLDSMGEYFSIDLVECKPYSFRERSEYA